MNIVFVEKRWSLDQRVLQFPIDQIRLDSLFLQDAKKNRRVKCRFQQKNNESRIKIVEVNIQNKNK